MAGLTSKLVLSASVAALGLGLAGCGSKSASDAGAAVTTVAPSTTSTTEAPKPFDPTKPVDLGGEPGVTPAEQHRAEALLAATIKGLKKFETPAAAQLAGFRSIGDGLTGDEHFVNWSYVNDGHLLDPTHPESLVYEMRNGKQQIAAAMYMMPFGSRFTDVPNVGGPLTQWHVHSNLCLTGDPEQKVVAGFAGAGQACPAGTEKAGNTPMLHVWTVPNECGPFAALEGIGAGEVPAGESRLCDTAHGSVG